MSKQNGNFQEPQIIEVEWVKALWEQAKLALCIHRHIGYLVMDTQEHIQIASGICVDIKGKIQVLNDKKTFLKKSFPAIAKVTPITVGLTDETYHLMEVKCEDPTGHDRFYSEEEAYELAPNLYRWCGYLVNEDDTYLRIASGLFEYESPGLDFELIHVIPKRMIIERRTLKRRG